MIGFSVDGVALKLSDNTSFSLEIDNPMFTANIGGSRLYNFSVPNRGNEILLDYAFMIPAQPQKLIIEGVMMYLLGQPYRKGTLVIRGADDTYTQLSFHSDAGALATSLVNFPLSSLPLQKYPLSFSHEGVYPDRAFAFPMMRNEAFYGASNPDFSGWVNYYNRGQAINTDKNLHTLVPMPFLRTVLDGIAQHTGYGLSGEWLFEEKTRRLLVHNNRSLDEIPYRINQYGKEINLAAHVPDISCGQFLVDLKNMFGLAVKVDPMTDTIYFHRFKDLVERMFYLDFTAKTSKKINLKRDKVGQFVLEMQADSSDELLRNQTNSWMTMNVLNPGGSTLKEEITTRASTILTQMVKDPLGGGRQLEVPVLSQKGFTDAFEIEGKASALRLLYYNGMQPDSYGALYPSASHQTVGHALRWEGASGLYEKNFKSYLQARADSFEVEREIRFDAHDLISLDIVDKIMIEGMKYYIKNIRLGIRKNDKELQPSRVTLINVPY
jgi:hypothetical protein